MRAAVTLLCVVAALSCHRAPRALPSSATDVGVAQPLSGEGAYWGDRRPAVFPDEWPLDAGRAATFGARAMVVSDAPLATQVGVEMLRRGGNAVDAAVAVGFALAVVYPEAGNLGGGGYMVVRMADGRTAALDYREVAPLAATRDMFLDERGEMTDKSVVGPLASGVPGAVAGLVAAHARYGTLPLADVMRPAIHLAADGFPVDSALARSLHNASSLIAQFAGAETFLPGGAAPAPGTVLKQPALARTLDRIGTNGADGFYRGETARAIADELQRLGGIITVEDLARYQPVWREPVRATYRGHTILSMPPSSSGGVTIAETLNILEGFDSLPAFGSARRAHLLASAYQRAFLDRNEKLADPAFVAVPIAELTSKAYAAALRATIDTARATPTRSLLPQRAEGMETTHYSVVDAAGNAVATTTTINALYGSGVYIVGAGFFLNDEMDDFATRPGHPNMFGLVQGEANAVQPGKRMLSAMSPTIVLSPGDSLLLVLGARGGPRIITGTSQVIINVIDHRMTLADAMSAPRLHHQALPDTLRHEMHGLTTAVIDSLSRMNWGVGPTGGVGLVNAIMRVPGGYHGVADPRSGGRALGY
ncbi:MAG: gamma-glutamyltransferase [Gemmatimonadota bacterium]|nr:gamma-glutamyltransferase [Gemmatimonadota bacterium]